MNIIFPILLISAFFSHTDPGAAGTAARWGYLLHSSRVSGAEVQTALRRYGIIARTGFILEGDGRLSVSSPAALKELITASRGCGATVYPVISFRSAALGERLLKNRSARERAVRGISRLCAEWAFRGVHFDFEYCAPEYAPLLARFLAETKSRLTGTLTMALFPPVGFPEKLSRFHDLSLLSPHLDGIVIMCYDLHGEHTGPGPVTDVRWAERNIGHALRFMKPERIWLGIPAYGYLWYGGKARALSAREGVALAKMHDARRDESGNLTGSFKRGNDIAHLFLADRHTRVLLEKLAQKHDLAGVALWRIGFED